jgi:hypothetical protein
VELFLNQYVEDRPFRALAINMSATGILLQKLVERSVPLAKVVGVEFEIPGTGEIVWASAEPRFDTLDEDFQTSGLTFINMARKHECLLREFVQKKASLVPWRRVLSPGTRVGSFTRSV